MNMRIVLGFLLMLILFGCVSDSAETSGKVVQDTEPSDSSEAVDETDSTDESDDTVPGIMDVKDTDEIIEDKKDGPVATSQNDCSTLSPNCETCVAQSGCGWCKSRNGCFFGDASGPAAGIADCPAADWAYDEQACQGSKGGISCEENWNCADCLSGSGCMWCIDGSKCASEGTSDECKVGGWLKESFQCNYASR
jgi:hypothetical protein